MATTLAADEHPRIRREQAVTAFLQTAGWGDALRDPIPGDASFRRYERLRRGESSAILMDAPPERENTRAFVNAQRYFAHAGYSVPGLIAERAEEGLLLLEDFGDDSVSLALRRDPAQEEAIYRDAVDLLAAMARQGLTRLDASGSRFPPYDAALLEQEIEVCAQWFLPDVLPVIQAKEGIEAFRAVWKGLFAGAELEPRVAVHRDYHADNLFLLPERDGIHRIGLLDFQDAVLGRPAYDLVSLLEDARRDVSPQVVAASLDRYIAESGETEDALRREYAFYGAQRNAKILGIFTRLYRRDGKPRYLGMIPRVWRYFDHNLRHPSLAPLLAWRRHYITPAVEQRILHLEEALTGTETVGAAAR